MQHKGRKTLNQFRQGVASSELLPGMAPAGKRGMRKIMHSLFALQKLKFDGRRCPTAARAELECLRAEVPPHILAFFERIVARGKKAVATARNGVCSECHLRITSGKLIGLSAGIEIQVCDNCGRYLYLPETDSAGQSDITGSPSGVMKRKQREVVHHVA